MKNLYRLLFIIISIPALSQTPIIPLFSDTDNDIPGAYYKDTFNDFDNFTGTWIYTNGSTSLKITLQKREQWYSDFSNEYHDVVIGGYRYVENGVEKINTMGQLSLNYPNVFSYNIIGYTINLASNYLVCNSCNPNQKRLILGFSDPTRSSVLGLDGEIILRRVDVGGVQKIELILEQKGHLMISNGVPPQYTSFNVPWGTYILTKVN